MKGINDQHKATDYIHDQVNCGLTANEVKCI